MNQEPRNVDTRPSRGPIVALMIGVFLLLWVWLMIMVGSPVPPKPRIVRDGADAGAPVEVIGDLDPRMVRLRSAPLMLVTGVVLVLVFVVASFVLVRGMRRLASDLGRRRAKPTPISDVWSMHVLPDEKTGKRPTER